ncbi:MAG: HAD-IA family hydrolase [Betaproteobacteria bacterium]|nr:HAD-IA family hydrolase [Betaproteobacteria bacterium]
MSGKVPRYRLLVFDWDGTLADSAAIIVEAIQLACADLGLPIPTDAAARYVIGLGLHDALRHVTPTLAEKDYPALSARYRVHYLNRDPEIPLFAGADILLSSLNARGHALAVATGKSRRGLDRALEQAGIGARFAATRCADEGFPKPNPDMLLYLMDRLGAAPEETLMIGDTTHDLMLAANAGVDAIGVAYGAHPGPALAAQPNLAIVGSVEELALWLGANA